MDDLKEASIHTINEIKQWTEDFSNEPGMTPQIVTTVIPDIEINSPGNIYLNFKAHKPPDYPGRMITTGCTSFIENLSAHKVKMVFCIQISHISNGKLIQH